MNLPTDLGRTTDFAEGSTKQFVSRVVSFTAEYRIANAFAANVIGDTPNTWTTPNQSSWERMNSTAHLQVAFPQQEYRDGMGCYILANYCRISKILAKDSKTGEFVEVRSESFGREEALHSIVSEVCVPGHGEAKDYHIELDRKDVCTDELRFVYEKGAHSSFHVNAVRIKLIGSLFPPELRSSEDERECSVDVDHRSKSSQLACRCPCLDGMAHRSVILVKAAAWGPMGKAFAEFVTDLETQIQARISEDFVCLGELQIKKIPNGEDCGFVGVQKMIQVIT